MPRIVPPPQVFLTFLTAMQEAIEDVGESLNINLNDSAGRAALSNAVIRRLYNYDFITETELDKTEYVCNAYGRTSNIKRKDKK